MTPKASSQIPVLTDVIPGDKPAKDDGKVEIEILRDDLELILGVSPRDDAETLIAELQTRLSSEAFSLVEDIMRSAFAEMEAKLFEQVSARLRRELPELIDALLRERLADAGS